MTTPMMLRSLLLGAPLLVAPLLAAPLSAQERLGPPPLTAPGADEWYLRAPDTVSLYIREFGRGEPVIVLHGGWGMDHGYMLPALNGLEDNAHFVVYDQRGSLRSPAPAEKISVDRHVEDLDLLRQRLGVERVTILGHSMGTFLAQAYLQKHPAHVKGLILVGAIPPVSDTVDRALAAANRVGNQLATRPEVDAELRKQGLLGKTDLTDQEATRAWRIRFAGVNVFHVDRWRQMEGGRVFYSQSAANATSRTMPAEWNFIPALRSHPCPVHVVIGTHDYVDFGVVKWKEVVKQAPALRLHVLPQAGHAAWIDQPELFRRAVAEAIRASAGCSP